MIHKEPSVQPIVPDELTHFLRHESFQEVHARWRLLDYEDIQANMPEPVQTEFGRVVILDPVDERDDSNTVVLALPHQQPWQPSHYIRSEFARQVVAPNSRMIVLPNNSGKNDYYNLTREELGVMEEGDLTPFYQIKARILETLELDGEVTLTGYSLGGLAVLGIAGQSPNFNVRLINADETPNHATSSKQLMNDFLKSGGWSEQRQAIADAKISALSQALSIHRLARDYALYGMGAIMGKNNSKAMIKGMAGVEFDSLILKAQNSYPDATLKLGHVIGSRLFIPNDSHYNSRLYTGRGTHMHATGDNVVAHALMIADAMQAKV